MTHYYVLDDRLFVYVIRTEMTKYLKLNAATHDNPLLFYWVSK